MEKSNNKNDLYIYKIKKIITVTEVKRNKG